MARSTKKLAMFPLATLIVVGLSCSSDSDPLDPISGEPAESGIVVRTEVSRASNEEPIEAWIDISILNATDTTFVRTTSSTCDVGFDIMNMDHEVLGPYEQCWDASGELILGPGESIHRRLWWDGMVVMGTHRYDYLPDGNYLIAGGIQWGEIVVLGDTVSFDWER